MKSSRSKFIFRNSAILILCLISLMAPIGYGAFTASSSTASRDSISEQTGKAQKKAPLPQAPQAQVAGKPTAPSAVGVTATLTDNVAAATKVAPGGTINYTAVITSTGGVGEDATAVTFNAPLDANTTYNAGTVHASPIAFNDTYSWVGNTQLDTTARALPAVTANDVAVNATLPAMGTDTFNVVTQAGAATALSGVVTLNANGSFVYTPPLGRPNSGDGASVNDSFTYTITNSADATLVGTGTVTITLTGRVWYLQAGAAGDGRSNTPSGSPSAMSTAADKSTDIFYIFSNAGSLNGLFTVDAGQQLLGQGVNLVVNTITLFTAAAPTPTTTNTAGNAVTLAGAPGNNTLSGFNIGNSTGGTAITGANVGTLNVSTMSINTNGGALDLTGVGTPTVSVVLGGTTSTGGARNVSLAGLNGTVTLAGGALSGATGNALHVDGGNAGITYSGTISNSGARQVNIINKTGGTVALSGAIGGTGTGIFLNANNGATLNFTGGITLSTGANDGFTATGPGPAATSGGTINVTQNNTTIVNTLTSTTGSALNIANTTIGASGVTFRSISSNGGSSDGIIVNNTGTTAGLTVSGNGGTCTSAATCTGGAIQNKTGGDGSGTQGSGIFLNNTSGVSIDRMQMNDFQNFGIKGSTVTGFSFTNSRITGTSGTTEAGGSEEGPIRFDNLFTSGAFPTATITGSTIQGAFSANIRVTNAGGTLNRLVIDNCTLPSMNSSTAPGNGSSSILFDVGAAATGGTLNFTISNSTISGARSHGLSFTAHGGAHMDAVVTQNKVQNADTHILSAASNLLLQGGDLGVADITYNISCNKFSTSAAGGGKGAGVILFKATNAASGSMVGTFSGNAIGVVGQAFSGAPNSAPALWVQDHGAGTFTTLIQNNTIVEYGEEAIDLQRTSGSSTMNASVFGNTVTPHSPDGFCGLNIEQGAVTADTGVMNLVVGNFNAGSGQQNNFSAGDASNFSDIQVLRAGSSTTVLNLSRNGSAAGTVAQVLKDDNVNAAATTVFIPTAGNMNLVAGLPALPPAIGACSLPSIPNPDGESARNLTDGVQRSEPANVSDTGSRTEAMRGLTAIRASEDREPYPQRERLVSYADLRTNSLGYLQTFAPFIRNLDTAFPAFNSSNASTSNLRLVNYPVTAAVQKTSPGSPQSGETVNVPMGTLPGGKSVTIKYSATVNAPPLAKQVSTQGTVSGSNFTSVLTDDPEPAGTANPTVTLIDTLMTWNGVTSTDWNTATNWTPPAGGTQYAPGVSNPAINDVVIPNVGNQPNISATDIGIFSLNISNGRTLTITSPRVLTIGGSPGGDLTLDGIISGGNLNLGTGTHVINNAGGTGSLSSTNVATVLSGSTVTLNNNLQAGALAVNAGGSMNITNRTLSLNGSGAALVIPGGATFTTTSSTVTFNGTAAQQAPGIAYNSLTINNSIGPNVTGVTLTGNATVSTTLTLTSSDLDTGAFTLTMPLAATSAGVSDVAGNVKRTGFVVNGAALSFGNPFNSIKINTGTTTAPTDITVNLDKAVPTTPAPFAAAIARKYTITPTGGTGISATLRLHYRDPELNGNAEGAPLNLFRYDGANWHKEGQTANDIANNWVEKNNVTQFSPWTMNSTVPTEVRIESVTATAYDGGTLIEWRTGFEVDNLGFNVYRDEGGKRVSVNPQIVAGSALLAGSGTMLGAGRSYSWWDKGVADQYWIESVDLDGNKTLHGPVSVKHIGGVPIERSSAALLSQVGIAQSGVTRPLAIAAPLAFARPDQIGIIDSLAGQAAVKLAVKREGFYRVTGADLFAAGLDPKAGPDRLQLYADGIQVPIKVVADKQGLVAAVEFYGVGLDTASTDARVYWLIAGSQAGLRMAQVKGSGFATAASSFLSTVERKDRTIYFSSLRNGERENFFGAVVAGEPVDQSLVLPGVASAANAQATIEVALQGVTNSSHRVWAYVNGSFAGELLFGGQAQGQAKLSVQQSQLREGDNTVRLVAQGGPSDVCLVDYIRVSYWHGFAADDNALRMTATGGQATTVSGFTSSAIRVFDVTDADRVEELAAKVEQQRIGYSATFTSPRSGDRRLLAIADEKADRPAGVAANRASNLRGTNHAADLVIITRRDFSAAFDRLAKLRASQGIKAEIVEIDDIYDEFSFGNKSPQAVKDFLQYAKANWKTGPRFVLLAGDSSYDSRNYLGLGDWDIAPAKLIDTGLMETASDDWFADFDNDGLAELAVGRLPVRTADEAATMVEKIISYEGGRPSEEVLLVADVSDTFDFEGASAQLRALIPPNLRVNEIDRGGVDGATARSRLIEAINRGQKVVNYVGHGSINLWRGGLLSSEDASLFENVTHPSLFIMMTCLNGYSHAPELDSLAEALMKARGGAVAVWASSGMTGPDGQTTINQQMYRLIFDGGSMTLGEATNKAKASVSDIDVRRTWVLLGDPTMRLR